MGWNCCPGSAAAVRNTRWLAGIDAKDPVLCVNVLNTGTLQAGLSRVVDCRFERKTIQRVMVMVVGYYKVKNGFSNIS